MMKWKSELVRMGSILFFMVWLLYYSITPLLAVTPWLHADGNVIKDSGGNVVVLRGVDMIDIGATELWYGGVEEMVDRLTDPCDTQGSYTGWYTKVIRLAIYPEDEEDFSSPWTFEPGSNDFYNNLLRPLVDYCATKDIYAIVDWHYIGDTFDSVTTTSAFWEYMAPLFANDSHVIYELFNEPINDVGDDTADWLSVRTDMQTWIDIVRTYAPNNLILVAGASWSQIIGPAASYPLSDPIGGNNLAIVSHIYPGHWTGYWGDPQWYKDHIDTCNTVYPVFMSEWGFSEDSGGGLAGTITNYGQPLMDWIEARKISNSAWCASYAWGPPMFDSNYTLRCGEGQMGCFVKDTLYLRRNDDLAGGGDTTPPAAPTSLTATGGEGIVWLDWDDNGEGDLDGYNVYRSTTSGSGYSQINSALVSSSDYNDTDVANGVTYYYVVTAVDTASNESGYSNEDYATPSNTVPPAAPTGLLASGEDETVYLDWNDNSEGDLDGYNVYRSTTSGSGYSQINGALVSSSDYTDTTVTNGITYYYVVTAIDTSSNESGYSSEVSATPDIPSGDVEIIGSWTSGLTHGQTSGINRALILIAHVEDASAIDLSSVTYGDQPMTKIVDEIVGTSYRAYVVAYILDEAGIAAATNDTFVPSWSTTLDDISYGSVFLSGVDQIDPIGQMATNGTASSTPNPITTVALATADGDMVIIGATCGNAGDYTLNNGFTETLETDMTSSTGVEGYLSATGTDEIPSVTHSGPNRQVIIGFVVQASSGVPEEPAAPTGLITTAGDGTVSLDWDDNSEGDLDGYNVYRSITSGSGYSQINGSLLGSSDYTDNSVTNGTTYYYVVTAVDTSLNESDYSNEDSTTPQDGTAPAAPTGLVATAGDGSVSLDWNDNTEPDLDSYTVLRSTTSGSGYSPIASDVASSNYTDNTVANGTTYYYVVTAKDTNDNVSGYSDEASATPLLYGDFTGNGIVDIDDLVEFVSFWLEDECSLTAGMDLDGNCVIDMYEFSMLAKNWLK